VLKGLASDGGLFIPEQVPSLPSDWASKWKDLSFTDLAYEILSLYISPSEIPSADLKEIINRSYSTFRAPETTPLVTLNEKENLYLLELFHGPTFAFKDVALQLLGNLFEYFLVRRNEGKTGKDRHHLTVVGATSGDTGSAAIYGLRGKKDVSVFILHPKGRVSPVQEAQMTTVLDANVHNLAVEGTFDDCQVITQRFSFPPMLTFPGHRKSPLRRPRNQRIPKARRRQLHQLGPHPGPNNLLLQSLLRPPEEPLLRPLPQGPLRRPYRQLRRHPRRLLRQAHGPPD